MYVKVMAAVIACILMSGETHSTSATIPATENQSWFKKRKNLKSATIIQYTIKGRFMNR